jgi:hypothetical protein
VDWHTPRRVRLRPTASVADGLTHLDWGVHEWTGLLVYWLSGRTDALLPAP